MTFSIRSYVAHSGERFSLLFSPDAPGVPLFYASAFLSRSLRNHNTHQTQLAALDAIRRLSEWERDQKISLEDRLLASILMVASDVDSLATHVRARRGGKKGEVICANKFNSHWIFICKYIAWLTDELLPNCNDIDVRELVKDQASRLKQKLIKRAGSKARHRQQLLDEKLPESARTQLLSIFKKPLEDLNSSPYQSTRMRNVVMIRILYETGMRRGELLSLKLKNFIESSGGQSAYLIIERNHDDELDRRINQPVAKTLGRSVPISEELERQLIEYRINYRAELTSVGHSDQDFIFCVHTGRTQGQPLTVAGFNSVFDYFQKSFPALGGSLHPHAFRHDWNYRFSQHADKMGMSENDEADAREESMGWVPGSAMAKVYNLRHRREKAMVIGREVARDTQRPIK
ncbi:MULTISPECIES: site-specific integrase [Pseudomonas]|uniref:Site-specific integrase n=1 Tax=Pseudomonas fluorescens TaxID=294 RepID=A0A2T0HSV5_PSEFL|nr:MULTISPECIES: site-specific integrase [Pseudomonas]PRW86023.1 site-specific integrase [Pseudomonas fluorescens]